MASAARPPLGLPRRLRSLSGKIFAAFLVVLVTFGGVTAYGAYAATRLANDVNRVVKGYLTVGLELQELHTRQGNLVQLLESADDDLFVKSAVDIARRYRKVKLKKAQEATAALLEDAGEEDERRFLRSVSQRLQTIDAIFDEDEQFFVRIFGPPGTGRPMISLGVDPAMRVELLRRESALYRNHLGELAQEFRERVQGAEAQLASHQRRAVWATVVLALLAATIGLGVMALVQRALRPLRQLAASAQQIARGDYRDRVDVGSSDEIGALAAEFNAMAGALEEREVRLIRSERLAGVGRIAAQITHEIRNPLSSIGLNAELLDEELGQMEGGASSQQLARAIVKEVDRLGEITEEYLRFARLPRPKLEREDLNGLISSLLSFMRGDLESRRVVVRASLTPGLPPIAMDENQIRQALLNLVRNGADAMAGKGGGALTVSTGRDGDFVSVRVEDEGEGITAEHRERIFDPFFTTKVGGTGLGLALTQQIVVEHGGAIDVESTPGRGTAFTVRLPIPRNDEGVASSTDRG